MRERIRRVLEVIARNDALERSWLQTLSLLEFIGARKIGKTAAAHHPPRSVLDHWADETRHAATFAGLAEDGRSNEAPAPAPLCADAAKAYFAELDTALSAWAAGLGGSADPLLNYLLVTTLIERRAMVIYPLYRAATHRPEVREALAQVIVEEQSHRVVIEERCRDRLATLTRDVFAEPLALEERLFSILLEQLEHAVTASATEVPAPAGELRPGDAARPG